MRNRFPIGEGSGPGCKRLSRWPAAAGPARQVVDDLPLHQRRQHRCGGRPAGLRPRFLAAPDERRGSFRYDNPMSNVLRAHLSRLRGGSVVFLTGAGVSAESGIPTFRGLDGFWSIGSVNYRPEELGTYQAFSTMPYEVWSWYLYRRGICSGAQPNEGHLALARIEAQLTSKFCLVTQNVDGLHLRAGNSRERLYEVHGSSHKMRCAQGCSLSIFEIPELGPVEREAELSQQQKDVLVCPLCGGLARPHLLWFDEAYDEEYYRCDSALQAVRKAGALITVGTSGATTLPMKLAKLASANGIIVIDINPETNPFSRMAQASGGLWMKETASTALGELAALLAPPREPVS